MYYKMNIHSVFCSNKTGFVRQGRMCMAYTGSCTPPYRLLAWVMYVAMVWHCVCIHDNEVEAHFAY